jgi:Terminase RNaseH-like domain
VTSSHYHVRDLKRFALGTQTPEIIENICRRMARRSLVDRIGLIVDATGIGSPVVQQMRELGLRPIPITITGGNRPNGFRVPKRDLLSRLLLLLQQGRLRISADLELCSELRKEFENFTIKYTAQGKPTYSASSGAHDDLIIALCLAVHFFECRRSVPPVLATVVG